MHQAVTCGSERRQVQPGSIEEQLPAAAGGRGAWVKRAVVLLIRLAKQHGVGQSKDANRIALRVPTFCGLPTREDAQQVLEVSVAQQQAITAGFTSLTTQK